jgi:regulatory protein
LQKLQRKKFDFDQIQTVLQQLTDEKLLNNTRFVTHYIDYRRNRGYGPLHIRAELMARGIQKEMIEHHLLINDNVWQECVKDVWLKRFKNQIPVDFKARVKQMRYLQQRGFTQEQIEHFYLKILAI